MKALIPTRNVAAMVAMADVDEPVPAPDEAVVRVEAFALNRGETFLLENPSATWRPGKDVAGRVIRSAADGSGPAVGTRVVAHPPSRGWAERVAVPVNRIAELPSTIDAVHAAALPLAGLTALRLTRAVGALAGKKILLTGASGGVGHYFVELATGVGAEVTVIAASEARASRLRDLGASAVATDVAEVDGAFDVVLESVGGTSFRDALERLAPRGLLVWFGQASRTPVTMDFFTFFAGHQSATIRHFDYTDSATTDGEDLRTLVRLVDAGRLHPEIGSVSTWCDAATRIADLRERRVRGKAVLTL